LHSVREARLHEAAVVTAHETWELGKRAGIKAPTSVHPIT